MAWAAANNIVSGYGDGVFRPDAPIPREQFAVILYCCARCKGWDTTGSADLDCCSDFDQLSTWAREAEWAIISGTRAATRLPRAVLSAHRQQLC